MSERLAFVLIGFLLGGTTGCGGERAGIDDFPQITDESSISQPDVPAATTVDWREQVRLVPVTYDQWTRELEALEGDVVVVDYWATWCVPCRERFPHMVAMAGRFDPQGVQFVSLSLDDRDDPLTIGDVTAFLEQQSSLMPNYLMDEIIPDAFDKLDLLGIPAVAVYDRHGNLYRRLTGDDPNNQFTEADVEQAVLELIEKG